MLRDEFTSVLLQHSTQITRLRVANLCCAGEDRLIRSVLSKLNGIEQVQVNIIGRIACIKHCPNKCCSSPALLVQKLNEMKLGASIQEANETEDEILDETPNTKQIIFAAFLFSLFLTGVILQSLLGIDEIYSSLYISCTIIGAVPIAYDVYVACIRRTIDVNVLMFVAIVGSISILEFLDSALVVVLFAIANVMEQEVFRWVRNACKISKTVMPSLCVLISGKTVPIDSLQIDDIVTFRAGEIISMDGKVVKGEAIVDESSITGEAVPISKVLESTVVSGAIVQDGYIEVKLTVLPENSTMQKLYNTLIDLQALPSKYGSMINEFASYWTPLVLAASAFLVLIAGGISNDWITWINRSLSLLVLACPCSIVLSFPIPCAVGLAVAAKQGVLVKGSSVIERTAQVNVLAVDKTGTLTNGFFKVCDKVIVPNERQLDPWQVAASLEDKSSHPLASAVVADYIGCIAESTVKLLDVQKAKLVKGVGVEGWVVDDEDDTNWLHCAVGNERLLSSHGGTCHLDGNSLLIYTEFVTQYLNRGISILLVIVEDELRGIIALADTVRPEAAGMISRLKSLGIEISMLTGDTQESALHIAKQVNICPSNVMCRLLPIDKMAWVQLKETTDRVMMVGDGINDATALAAAYVGVAMGAGSAMASLAAHIVIMTDKLDRLHSTLILCKIIRQVIFRNITFSMFLKLIAIALALMGEINLWQAVLIDMISILFVLLNSLTPYFLSDTIWDQSISVESDVKKEGKESSAITEVVTLKLIEQEVRYDPPSVML